METIKQNTTQRENGVDVSSPEVKLADLFHTLVNIAPVDPADEDAVNRRAVEANRTYVAIQEVATELTREEDREKVLRRAQEEMDRVMLNKETPSRFLVAD